MEPAESANKKKKTPRSSVLDKRAEYERLGAWLRTQRETAALQQKPTSRALQKPEQFLNKIEQGRQRIDVIEFLDLVAEMGIDTNTTLGDLLKVTGQANLKKS